MRLASVTDISSNSSSHPITYPTYVDSESELLPVEPFASGLTTNIPDSDAFLTARSCLQSETAVPVLQGSPTVGGRSDSSFPISLPPTRPRLPASLDTDDDARTVRQPPSSFPGPSVSCGMQVSALGADLPGGVPTGSLGAASFSLAPPLRAADPGCSTPGAVLENIHANHPQPPSMSGRALGAVQLAGDKVRSFLGHLLDPEAAAPKNSSQVRTLFGRDGSSSETPSESLFQSIHAPYAGPTSDESDNRRVQENHPTELGVQRVYLEGATDPFHVARPLQMAHIVYDDEDDFIDEDVEDDQPTVEVDFASAVQGYLRNPNECFGHLVAAALTTRSSSRPITGEELLHAQGNPYVVRLVITSGCLADDDVVAQREIKETMNTLIPTDCSELNPTLYEYLMLFFKLPFIRLSHRQYTLLKHSGFEWVWLMYDNQHVLPDEPLHSILINYSTPMRILSFVLMVVDCILVIFATVAIGLVLAHWMHAEGDSYRDYGFYTLIVFGCGYTLNLIFTIFFSRAREGADTNECADKIMFPSPLITVVPVFPIYQILCVVSYARLFLRDSSSYLVAGHDLLVASRLSGICFAMFHGVPQFIVQSYLNRSVIRADDDTRNSSYFKLAMVAVTLQWSVALIRFAWMMLAYDSTNNFGFARLIMVRPHRTIERHSGIPRIMHYLQIFVMEINIYLIVAFCFSFKYAPECNLSAALTLGLSSVSTFIILVVYGVLAMSNRPTVSVSFSTIPIVLLQVLLVILTEVKLQQNCSFIHERIVHDCFIFGYIVWSAYFAMFIIWVVHITLWNLWKHRGINSFPRLTASTVWRRRSRKDSVNSANEGTAAPFPSPLLAVPCSSPSAAISGTTTFSEHKVSS